MADAFLPYGRHWIEDDDIAAVAEVLRGDWLTQGPKVAEFEEAVAAKVGARHAVAFNSGTSALHGAILAAGIGTGAGGRSDDECASPAVSFLATANCALHAGAKPVFADVDALSVHSSPAHFEAVLTERTRAVMPVHFAGHAVDMPGIAELVRRRAPGAVIIEDACHAPGALHADGSPVGSLRYGDMVMFSFHPVKHAAAGEGGVITCDRDDLAAGLRLYRSHGMVKDPALLERPAEGPWYYEMHELGYNFRMPDMNAALGLSQWRKLDRFVARRRELAAYYHGAFADAEARGLLRRPPTGADPGREADPTAHRNSWHIYILHIDFARVGKPRTQVVAELRARGVGTQVHYFPVPLQPYYRRLLGDQAGLLPGAERHYAEALTIPLFPLMTDADAARVAAAVHEVLGA
ncbi:MAG: UDP-4-amino-4,6-dideoxy-N-acetyl-beta-L-altrosamine transaminase [Candidatus Sumerlaeia bacterium]|nr:UDP-4-amino-4,6-dideoxy-N-acetyl-beta-L-altrosamine transaminase [Candidatus Sumerlaeia bacterium]